ncbi:kinase-like domain-containing protein [Mycena leptocephala]|nr:kinase-like domain-containing protein [Mycena leptocephala]
MSPARAITLKNGEHVQTVVLKPGSDFESEGLKLTKWAPGPIYLNGLTCDAAVVILLDGDNAASGNQEISVHVRDPKKLTTPVEVDDLSIAKLCLGKGTFSKVYVARRIDGQTIKQFACKTYRRRCQCRTGGQHIYGTKCDEEQQILNAIGEEFKSSTDMPCEPTMNVVRAYKIFEIKHYPVPKAILLDVCAGGDLGSYLNTKVDKWPDIGECKRIVFQVAQGLQALHDALISHGGKQLENILLWDREYSPRILLSDLGLAKSRCTASTMNACGTPGWMSPQAITIAGQTSVHERQSRLANDCWGLGILMGVICVNRHPFFAEVDFVGNETAIDMDVVQTRVRALAPVLTKLPNDARELVEGLLRKDQAGRLNIHQGLDATWFSTDEPLNQWYDLQKRAFRVQKRAELRG